MTLLHCSSMWLPSGCRSLGPYCWCGWLCCLLAGR
jgi:hypothetical protein